MFGIEPTPLDLQFHLGRIPVRVHPGFWVVGALGGWNPDDLRYTFIWIVCLFVSILIHELGHALLMEAFGWPAEILLYHFGGLAFPAHRFGYTSWKWIAVCLAGPCAGFAFFGVILAGVIYFRSLAWLFDPSPPDELVHDAAWQLVFINLFWGLVNLAPVLPLDGGQVCRSFFDLLRLRTAESATLVVSFIVGGLMSAFFFVVLNNTFAGMLFLFLTMQNFATLQQLRGRW